MNVKQFKITQQQYHDLAQEKQRHLILDCDTSSMTPGDYVLLNPWDSEHQVYLNPDFRHPTEIFYAGSSHPQTSSALIFEVMFVETLEHHQILSLRPETHTIRRSLARTTFDNANTITESN